jgi:dipeptidyl aminopeptidase/acylaminoacyl peptidase
MSGSPYQFIRVSWSGPLPWLTRGYAVLDGPTMPIIGEGEEEPNDTFVKQLVASAKAAIAEVVRRGVGDPKRIAVGGHSYGAFMTANLLAHSDLFAAGIARSGAYNRTLTPFGFQSEERTYWEAPEIYYTMSPFMHADKVNEPILLIHGMADNNSGTFPLQSERFYNAVKGHGGTARLVMLPNESHGYRARESIMHTLWEMDCWLEKYVKHGKD